MASPDQLPQTLERRMVIMPNPLTKIIAPIDWFVAEGAIGTSLFGRGLKTGYRSELWSVERSNDILWLRKSPIDAGSDLPLSKSCDGTSLRLEFPCADERVAEPKEAWKLARQAIDAPAKST